LIAINLIRLASQKDTSPSFTESGQIPSTLGGLTQRQTDLLMGKAPLRRIISRIPFDSNPTTTWIETLDCGHERLAYLEWKVLSLEIPQATHRRCQDCRTVEHVLLYLAAAEAKESDPWLQDDIRVAYKTCVNAQAGMSDPWIQAFCSYFGKHPKKAIPLWAERAAKREALLGPGLTEISPKKPNQSVRLPQKRKIA